MARRSSLFLLYWRHRRMGIGPVRTFSAIPPTASRRAPPVLEYTTKHPVIEDDRVSYKKVAATYSPTWWGSTIGDGELNFSVRNGKRWILTAITATVYVLRKDTDIDSDTYNSDRFHRLSLSTFLGLSSKFNSTAFEYH